MPLESDIQSDIIAYLRGRGDVYVYNATGNAMTGKGTPDIICCFQGRFVSFEVKRPDSSYRMTKPQQIRRRQIESAGGWCFEVMSLEDTAQALLQVKARLWR